MAPLNPHQRRIAYARLVRGCADTAAMGLEVESQWDYLMAAHVVGQDDPALHFDSHRRMLALARESGDWGEVAGQVARLALLPLGHLLRRVPTGNVGRSTVPITQVMEPPEKIRALIALAVEAVELPA